MYSAADVLFNPTWEDNIPTVNLEAISCGTPVITYDTGGCSEIITPNTGYVIKKGNIIETKLHIEEICSKGKDYYPIPCRKSAVQHFNQDERFQEYINLYNNILNK
jgi:glycosyltransferase involved in cell wall biosynthesis